MPSTEPSTMERRVTMPVPKAYPASSPHGAVPAGPPAKVIAIPAPLCLYSKRGLELIAQIKAYLEAPAPIGQAPVTVILHQEDASHDAADQAWLEELSNTLLLEELASRIHQVQQTLAAISTSPIAWVYASKHSCQGSLWELALAAHHRLWFNPDAVCGFPDLAEQPPPLSLLLPPTPASDEGHSLEFWQKNPSLAVATAAEHGLFAFLLRQEDALAVSQRWLRYHHVAPQGLNRVPLPSQAPLSLLPFAAVLQAESRWLKEKKLGDTSVAGDWTGSLQKLRRQLANPQEFASLCSYSLARQLLSTSYRRTLGGAGLIQPASGPSASALQSLSASQAFCFEVSDALPPVSMVEALLRAQRPVIFVASHGKTLAAALERYYLKLERRFPQTLLQSRWQELMTWFVGTVQRVSIPRISCELSDSLRLHWQGQSWQFINLQGNHLGAPLGLWELIKPQTTTELPAELTAHLLPTLCQGIVASPFASEAMPLTTWIRCHFLDEMMRLSQRLGADLNKMAAALEGSGWGFAATSSQWGRFLQIRPARSEEYWPTGLAAYAPVRDHADLGSWKHACQLVERQRQANEELWHATGVSQHLALYAAALSSYLAVHGFFADEAGADFFVTKALELPSTYGTPREFATAWGPKRFAAYRSHHWPAALLGPSEDAT